MKIKFHIFCLFLFFLIPTIAFAANIADILREPATKLQEYLSGRDKLIISDIYSVGELKEQGMVFEAIIAYEPDISTKVGGLQIYTREPQERQYYFAYVDADDLDGIVKAIISMIDLHSKQNLTTGETKRRILYSTKGGFMLELEESASKERIFIGGKTLTVILQRSDLKTLQSIFEKAREILTKNNITK